MRAPRREGVIEAVEGSWMAIVWDGTDRRCPRPLPSSWSADPSLIGKRVVEWPHPLQPGLWLEERVTIQWDEEPSIEWLEERIRDLEVSFPRGAALGKLRRELERRLAGDDDRLDLGSVPF